MAVNNVNELLLTNDRAFAVQSSGNGQSAASGPNRLNAQHFFAVLAQKSADHVFRLGPIQSWPFCKKLPEQFYYFSTFSPLKNRPKTCPHHQSSEAFSLKNL